jgi:hypothetical protein
MDKSRLPFDAQQVHRYAVYFAPRLESAWWQAGSKWLGRCAARSERRPQPAFPGISESQLEQATLAPRRYGWHATLRAPFALAPGVTRHQLQSLLRELGEALQSFQMPPMKVARLGNFLALVPVERCAAIDEVARTCLINLHPLAKPPTPEEFDRRRAATLSPEEEFLLAKWGYPFVMERFRFHMSLTGALDGVEPTIVHRLEEAARSWFSELPPLAFSSLTLFAEPMPMSEFIVIEQIDLRG